MHHQGREFRHAFFDRYFTTYLGISNELKDLDSISAISGAFLRTKIEWKFDVNESDGF